MTSILHAAVPDTLHGSRAVRNRLAGEDGLRDAITSLMVGQGYSSYEIRDLTEELTGEVLREHFPRPVPHDLVATAPWVSRHRDFH